MKSSDLEVKFDYFDIPFDKTENTLLMIPMQNAGSISQVHYALDLFHLKGVRIEIGLAEYAAALDLFLDPQTGRFPLDLNSCSLWKNFCIGPHSDTLIRNHLFQVGNRSFNRFIELNVDNKTAQIQNPEINDDFLSSSNWIDPLTGNCWFASWDIRDSIQRLRAPKASVKVRVWEFSRNDNTLNQKWDGHLGDFLHQLNISPDNRYLVLCEMGMRPASHVPPGHPGNNEEEWRHFQLKGLVPSEILIMDLVSGNEWKLTPEIGTAAHVEFDPDDPHLCYISCHNVSMIDGSNVLFGNAAILRCRLGPCGPEIEGKFSNAEFYRSTSHCVFKHRGRTVIGVTGFQDKFFLIDAKSMELLKCIQLFDAESISTLKQPCFCKPDKRAPYGLTASNDGEILYIAGNGLLFVLEIQTGLLKFPMWEFVKNQSEEFIAGHMSKVSVTEVL